VASTFQRIGGRIVLTESGVGIPNLVVTAFDVTRHDAATAPSETADVSRLGAVITGQDGGFEVVYPCEPARSHDIVVVVRAPDGEREGAKLYTTPEPRRKAGPVEEFLITLTSAALEAAGLTPPAGSDDTTLEQPAFALHGAKATLARTAVLKDELRQLAKDEVDKERERARTIDEKFQPRLLDQLTGHASAKTGYIAPGSTEDEVHTASWNALARSANRSKPPTVGYIQLPRDDVPTEFPTAAGTPTDVPAPIVERELFGAAEDAFRTADRTREDPLALAEDQASQPPSLTEALADPAPAPDPTTPPPGQPPVATEDDLPAYIHRLVDTMATPDAPPTETRTDQAAVQNGTDTFALRGGPADVPAIYDFHHLQIAFDHVWTHAVDEEVIEISSRLARAVSDAGGDPVTAVDEGAKPLQALRAELGHVMRAETPTIPTALARRPVDPMMNPNHPTLDPGDPGYPPVPPTPPPPTPPHWPPIGPVVVGGVKDAQIDGLPKQPHELLDQLEALLHEQYSFEVFAPGSVNYGLNVTYRQRWEPLTYQVGDLVGTITLTPRETRKINIKRVERKERMVREMEDSLEVRKDESKDQGRDEAEIVRKAQGKTSFSLTAEGSYDIGIADGDSKTSFTKDASDDSADTKKSMREAVLQAAREYKNNHKLEIETKETSEFESTESTEITNPNDELTVTYLFYELQRRFRICEQLHRLTPVVLVGMEVPNPSRRSIDRILITHSWIINRVLLDDRYRDALRYLTTTIVGDELALRERQSIVNRLRTSVETIERNHAQLLTEVKQRNNELERMMNLRADKIDEEAQEGWWGSLSDWVTGEGEGDDLEAVRVREENARAYYEKAVRAEQELRESLRSEAAALHKATADYAQALAEHSNRLLQIAALRVHFKANVLYYMQAIWSHTFRDQLYFSVHKLKAPTLRASSVQYTVERLDVLPAHIVPKPDHVVFQVTSEKVFSTPGDPVDPVDPAEDRTLAEIADLDSPLGFKGNYMIFPLKRSNALTDFMMTPYIDTELGVHDPDELGAWTPEDFVKHVKALRNTLSEADFDQLLPILEEQYRRILSAPRRPGEEIVVPSRSLYIDALPGKHPNLEDFKLRHRAVDVSKARAEVRKLELENLRYAGRLLVAERGDPDIDKQILIDGNGSVVVPPEA
jgi:hypothetical protein